VWTVVFANVAARWAFARLLYAAICANTVLDEETSV
jgi:hypothetical protein